MERLLSANLLLKEYPFKGSDVPSVNLRPILYKRLKIQGSTLRSRSLDYQTELINRCVNILKLDKFLNNGSTSFGTIVDQITGAEGSGPIRTYIHKVRDFFGSF